MCDTKTKYDISMKGNQQSALRNYLDNNFHKTTLLALLAAVLCLVGAFILPESQGGKNSLPEHFQLLLLVLCSVLSFTAKERRSFFIFAGFVLVLLFLREINFGRTLWFFADPDNPEKFKKWKEIPYGWLHYVVIGLYLAGLVLAFFCRKLYLELVDILRSCRIPTWECAIMVLAAISAQLVERISHFCLLEEACELTFYSCLTLLVWRYTRGKCRPTDAAGGKGV